MRKGGGGGSRTRSRRLSTHTIPIRPGAEGVGVGVSACQGVGASSSCPSRHRAGAPLALQRSRPAAPARPARPARLPSLGATCRRATHLTSLLRSNCTCTSPYLRPRPPSLHLRAAPLPAPQPPPPPPAPQPPSPLPLAPTCVVGHIGHGEAGGAAAAAVGDALDLDEVGPVAGGAMKGMEAVGFISNVLDLHCMGWGAVGIFQCLYNIIRLLMRMGAGMHGAHGRGAPPIELATQTQGITGQGGAASHKY